MRRVSLYITTIGLCLVVNTTLLVTRASGSTILSGTSVLTSFSMTASNGIYWSQRGKGGAEVDVRTPLYSAYRSGTPCATVSVPTVTLSGCTTDFLTLSGSIFLNVPGSIQHWNTSGTSGTSVAFNTGAFKVFGSGWQEVTVTATVDYSFSLDTDGKNGSSDVLSLFSFSMGRYQPYFDVDLSSVWKPESVTKSGTIYVNETYKMLPGYYNFSAALLNQVTMTSVPEPSTLAMLGSAAVGLAGLFGRYRAKIPW